MELLQQIRGVIDDARARFPNEEEASAAIKRSAAFFGGGGRSSMNPHVQAARLITASEQIHRRLMNRGQFFWWEQWTAEG